MVAEFTPVEIVEQLIQQAQVANASDIHLQINSKTGSVSFRLDGVLSPPTDLPADTSERVAGRIKFLARLKTYQDSLPQDGRIAKEDVGSRNDIRVATYPTVTGEKIVLRLFSNTGTLTLSELGFPNAACHELEAFLRQTAGLLLLTGPAGSGKTTTIYACLRHLAATSGRHIITIEDPVEQVIPDIMQTEINDARGLTFAKATLHLLRQDPQVLVLGEIRDDETANLAVRAALTGHMVISTLHAGSCAGVFERLLVMCPDRHAVMSVVEMVVNQRLVRRSCSGCAGAGCAVCLQTGYKGSVPLVEWVHGKNAATLVPDPSLETAACNLVATGVTNEMEIRRVLGR